jgi:hypothetical protein
MARREIELDRRECWKTDRISDKRKDSEIQQMERHSGIAGDEVGIVSKKTIAFN